MIGRFGSLLQVINLGLEIFQVLLLSFTESALGGTILSLAFLIKKLEAIQK